MAGKLVNRRVEALVDVLDEIFPGARIVVVKGNRGKVMR